MSKTSVLERKGKQDIVEYDSDDLDEAILRENLESGEVSPQPLPSSHKEKKAKKVKKHKKHKKEHKKRDKSADLEKGDDRVGKEKKEKRNKKRKDSSHHDSQRHRNRSGSEDSAKPYSEERLKREKHENEHWDSMHLRLQAMAGYVAGPEPASGLDTRSCQQHERGCQRCDQRGFAEQSFSYCREDDNKSGQGSWHRKQDCDAPPLTDGYCSRGRTVYDDLEMWEDAGSDARHEHRGWRRSHGDHQRQNDRSFSGGERALYEDFEVCVDTENNSRCSGKNREHRKLCKDRENWKGDHAASTRHGAVERIGTVTVDECEREVTGGTDGGVDDEEPHRKKRERVSLEGDLVPKAKDSQSSSPRKQMNPGRELDLETGVEKRLVVEESKALAKIKKLKEGRVQNMKASMGDDATSSVPAKPPGLKTAAKEETVAGASAPAIMKADSASPCSQMLVSSVMPASVDLSLVAVPATKPPTPTTVTVSSASCANSENRNISKDGGMIQISISGSSVNEQDSNDGSGTLQPAVAPATSGEDSQEGLAAEKLKKPPMKFGIKISNTSAALIASGLKAEPSTVGAAKKDIEEGVCRF